MTQKDAQNLYSIGLDEFVSINGNPIKVVGKMREKYKHANGGVAEAYVLALEGRREIGIEFRNSKWYAWTSACMFSVPYSRTELERLAATLTDVETGTIKGMESEGNVSPLLPNYSFGQRSGSGVFLTYDNDTMEEWVSEIVDLRNVSIPLAYAMGVA